MTVVLFGAPLADGDEPFEWSCFTPHPASASQFRIAPGSHPRLYIRLNVRKPSLLGEKIPLTPSLPRLLSVLTFSSRPDLVAEGGERTSGAQSRGSLTSLCY